MGLKPMARPGRFAALSLTPSVLVAVILTAHFLMYGQMRYVAPVCAMCYGTGIYTAGLFSVRLPRLLGLAFIVMGEVGLFLIPEYGVVLTALTFGMLHIVFGIIVLRRAREEPAPWRAVSCSSASCSARTVSDARSAATTSPSSRTSAQPTPTLPWGRSPPR